MKNAFGKSPRQANEAENFGLGHLLGEAQENEFDIVLWTHLVAGRRRRK
jgi:hypothetical protein